MTRVVITKATWPLDRNQYTVGIPRGYGARLAVLKYGSVLNRLAKS